MSPLGTQPSVQGSRHTALIVRYGRGGHRDIDLPQLRAHAGSVAARAALPRVRGANALSVASCKARVVSVGFLDVDFVNVHLRQLQLPGELVVDGVPVRVCLDNPDARLTSAVAAALDTAER